MGTNTTGTFKFFKPAATDLVDPAVDMVPAIEKLDTRIFSLTNYKISTDNAPSLTGLENGSKVYDSKSGRIKYFYNDPVLGPQLLNIPKVNNVNPWNNIPLIGGWTNLSPTEPLALAAWRYFDNDTTRVELRGRITNLAGITNNAAINVTNVGAVPNPPFQRDFSTMCGMGASNLENNNSGLVIVTAVGQVFIIHYGTSTAGAIENYMCLDNIIYSTV
jgi:hypothetical protein